MNLYKFGTREFAISDKGFHLLRSGYNYKTIVFTDVQSITIGIGKQISNWLVALLFGIVLIFAGFYVLFYACYAFYLGITKVYVEQFAFAAIPIFIGTYSLYMSLKKGVTLEIRTSKESRLFAIDEWSKNGQIKALTDFLENNPLTTEKLRKKMKDNNELWKGSLIL